MNYQINNFLHLNFPREIIDYQNDTLIISVSIVVLGILIGTFTHGSKSKINYAVNSVQNRNKKILHVEDLILGHIDKNHNTHFLTKYVVNLMIPVYASLLNRCRANFG
jgi:hypothetical protein